MRKLESPYKTILPTKERLIMSNIITHTVHQQAANKQFTAKLRKDGNVEFRSGDLSVLASVPMTGNGRVDLSNVSALGAHWKGEPFLKGNGPAREMARRAARSLSELKPGDMRVF